jgi:hypothetical protein
MDLIQRQRTGRKLHSRSMAHEPWTLTLLPSSSRGWGCSPIRKRSTNAPGHLGPISDAGRCRNPRSPDTNQERVLDDFEGCGHGTRTRRQLIIKFRAAGMAIPAVINQYTDAINRVRVGGSFTAYGNKLAAGKRVYDPSFLICSLR